MKAEAEEQPSKPATYKKPNKPAYKNSVEAAKAYTELEYESLRDEAWNMAHTLQDIEKEVKDCAFCDGKEECGYSAKQLLKELCYIFARDVGYHRMDKYSKH